MATHSTILAWEIPWTEKPGGLQSMGSKRVGQDLVTKQQQNICCFDISYDTVMQENLLIVLSFKAWVSLIALYN